MPKLRSDHYAFPSFDAEATDRFYSEVLGLPLVFALSGPSPEWGGDFLLTAYALGDGRCLDFFAVRGLRRPPPDGLPEDIRHVALVVGSRRAVEAWKQRLDAHGVRRRSEDHGNGDEHLYFSDPNGLVLEIAARSDVPKTRQTPSRAARRTLASWLSAR